MEKVPQETLVKVKFYRQSFGKSPAALAKKLTPISPHKRLISIKFNLYKNFY